jgi:hypothetical protein
MKEEQCKAVTTGFLKALEQSQELRDRWVVVAQNEDWDGLRELIAGTLELDETPSEKDLDDMHLHAESHLSSKCKEIEELDRRIKSEYLFNGRHGPPGD